MERDSVNDLKPRAQTVSALSESICATTTALDRARERLAALDAERVDKLAALAPYSEVNALDQSRIEAQFEIERLEAFLHQLGGQLMNAKADASVQGLIAEGNALAAETAEIDTWMLTRYRELAEEIAGGLAAYEMLRNKVRSYNERRARVAPERTDLPQPRTFVMGRGQGLCAPLSALVRLPVAGRLEVLPIGATVIGNHFWWDGPINTAVEPPRPVARPQEPEAPAAKWSCPPKAGVVGFGMDGPAN